MFHLNEGCQALTAIVGTTENRKKNDDFDGKSLKNDDFDGKSLKNDDFDGKSENIDDLNKEYI